MLPECLDAIQDLFAGIFLIFLPILCKAAGFSKRWNFPQKQARDLFFMYIDSGGREKQNVFVTSGRTVINNFCRVFRQNEELSLADSTFWP